MRHVRFIPSELGEESLRRLARGEDMRPYHDLWDVHGTLELDLDFAEPLRLTCGNPVKHALEPLIELAHWGSTGRVNLLSAVLGTAFISRSNHLFHRWHGAFEAVLLLGERDSTLGVNRDGHGFQVTVLETDDQPDLEDEIESLTRAELLSLPTMLWDDLDALLTLLGIELEPRERARWQRHRLEGAPAQ